MYTLFLSRGASSESATGSAHKNQMKPSKRFIPIETCNMIPLHILEAIKEDERDILTMDSPRDQPKKSLHAFGTAELFQATEELSDSIAFDTFPTLAWRFENTDEMSKKRVRHEELTSPSSKKRRMIRSKTIRTSMVSL